MNELVGRQIENYRIDALLGEGGMGAVYRAFDLNLAVPVAIKVMHTQFARQKEFQQRFIQEARAAARLKDHPSIVTIHRFGQIQDLLYMVMALVTGGSLATHIQRLEKTGEAIQLQEMLALLAQVADALGFAHRNGVLHRDIKPSNVLLQQLEIPDREGDPPLRAIVTDFGLAKLLEGGLETRSGELMGTYAYMSPEQCLQKDLDGRSDIYSLGVMLYKLTTGRLPFDIKSPTDAVMKHLHEIPPAPSTVRTGLPANVEMIIQKAIAKKPEERFQKAEAMVLALREAVKRLSQAEVTKYTGERTILRLTTQVQSPVPGVEPSRMGFDISPLPTGDRLVIAQKEHTPYSLLLDKQQLTIGRSTENDIVLDHPDVSRQHARLEYSLSNWKVTDLKSTNGTFLDGNLLLAGVAEQFLPGKILRIGPYFLHWQAAGAKAGLPSTRAYPSGTGRSVPPDATHLQSQAGQIGVTVRPTTVEVMPNNRVDVQVELFNQGALVDHFKLRILEFPSTWVTVPQPEVELMPGTSSVLLFHIHPPQDSSARAKSYSYKLVVESQVIPGDTVTVSGQVIVKPFEGFTVDMQPSRVTHAGSSRVSIHNEGNTEGIYSLTGRDPANEVLFTGEQARIRVPPGETAVRTISVKSRKRSLIGSERTLPFELQISNVKGVKKGLLGQLVVRPRLPFWIVPLAGFLMLVCAVAGGLGLVTVNNRNKAATQTSEALQAAIVAQVSTEQNRQTQDIQAKQATNIAESQTAAAQATSAALTAIAQGDDDGDGLSNQKEAEIGTDPNHPDTDQDGLKDGQEVNEYGTNPKNKDSDGDNLSDGDEVHQYHTNPTNPDTDGDGVLDGAEVAAGSDPNKLPTATPLPTDTPLPTKTPTPIPPSKTPTPSPTPLPKMIGKWVNIDPEGGITRINIQFDGSSYFVETWGKCTPTDCYWNSYSGVSYEVSSVTYTKMKIVWTFSFITTTLKLEVLPDGRLKVSSHNHYTDSSGRTDYDATDYFARE